MCLPQVHHLRGAYGAALGCLLRSPRGAAAAFEYIAAALGGGRAAPRVPPGQLPALKAALLAAMPRLVGADAAAAARLVLRDFPGDHPAVVAALAESPLLQYRYLKGAMEVRPMSSARLRVSDEALVCFISPRCSPSSKGCELTEAVQEWLHMEFVHLCRLARSYGHIIHGSTSRNQ